MLNLLGETIGAVLGGIIDSLIFKPFLNVLERSRCFVIFVLLAAAGLCMAAAYSQTGSILGMVPVTLGMLVFGAAFLIARRAVANLPDPPAPTASLVASPLPDLETPMASANLDSFSIPAIAPELPRQKHWFHVVCALAGAAGQLVGYLLLYLPSNSSQTDFGLQLVCGFPFGLAAGLLVSFVLAPPAEIQKKEWRENLPRWALAPVVSFIVGVVIFLPVFFFLLILSAV